jgi:hypothetical protein
MKLNLPVGTLRKSGILKLFTRVETGEFRVLVNVVGERMMLLVHHCKEITAIIHEVVILVWCSYPDEVWQLTSLVFSMLKANNSGPKETNVIHALGLECIAMEKLMLTIKSKALKLKTIKQIGDSKKEELVPILKNGLMVSCPHGNMPSWDMMYRVANIIERLIERRLNP